MDQQTIDTYNLMATEYDQETTDFWDRFPRTILDRFAAETQGLVLDVGSGPGRDGLLLQDKGLQVICIDASETMVGLCRAKGLVASVADFHHLPFPDNAFDGVWAYTSLLHVPKRDLPVALVEIYRVIKTGGTFGIGLIEGNREGYRNSAGVAEPRWFSLYQKEEIESLLAEKNFEIIYFESFKPKTSNYLNYIARKI